jgi:hypothetical protein
MAVERSGEIQCAVVRRPRGFPPKIGRDLPKIGRSRKRRESARNAASSLFWAARPPLSYFPLALQLSFGQFDCYYYANDTITAGPPNFWAAHTVKFGALEIARWGVSSSFLKREVKSWRLSSSFLKFRNCPRQYPNFRRRLRRRVYRAVS